MSLVEMCFILNRFDGVPGCTHRYRFCLSLFIIRYLSPSYGVLDCARLNTVMSLQVLLLVPSCNSNRIVGMVHHNSIPDTTAVFNYFALVLLIMQMPPKGCIPGLPTGI